VLTGDIGAHIGVSLQPGRAGDIDDASEPTRAHSRQRRLAGGDGGEQVHRQHGLKVTRPVLEEWFGDGGAGIVHQNVARAKRGHGFAERVAVGNIGDGMACPKITRGLVEGSGIAADDRNGGAVGSEATGNGEPDSLAAAGDKGGEVAKRSGRCHTRAHITPE
jgi:hypothetical protein